MTSAHTSGSSDCHKDNACRTYVPYCQRSSPAAERRDRTMPAAALCLRVLVREAAAPAVPAVLESVHGEAQQNLRAHRKPAGPRETDRQVSGFAIDAATQAARVPCHP